MALQVWHMSDAREAIHDQRMSLLPKLVRFARFPLAQPPLAGGGRRISAPSRTYSHILLLTDSNSTEADRHGQVRYQH
jgi:hypothetical protein